jgi:glycosyltransferase 2 family protein
MTASVTQVVKTILKLAFAAALIFWMVREDALNLETFSKLASPLLVLLLATLIFLQIFINNYRWLTLMRGQGFEASIGYTLPLSLIGMFFNFAMPGGVGGDVMKGFYLLQDHPRQKFAGAVSIFMDRMMGFFVMIATAFFALFFNWSRVSESPQLRSIALGVSILFFVFLVFYFLSLSRLLQNSTLGQLLFEKLPGGSKLRALYDALHAYRKAPGALALAALLSFVNQIGIVIFVIAVSRAMNVQEIPIQVYFFLVPVGVVVQALPISPAGIGVGQAAFYFLFNLYLGRESQLGPTAVTAMQILSFFWGLFGAYFYLRRKKPMISVHQA